MSYCKDMVRILSLKLYLSLCCPKPSLPIVVEEDRAILHLNDQSFSAIVIQTDSTILTKCEEEIKKSDNEADGSNHREFIISL